jgi:DNA-binding NarL/FixJ family response regulator
MIQGAVIDDECDIRKRLRSLIAGTPGFAVFGGYRSMEEALSNMPAALPHVALIDTALPGMSGIQRVRLFKESYPAVRVQSYEFPE